MNKMKTTVFLLLTVLALVAGSLLPSGVAYLQDKSTEAAVQYEDIEALQLQMKEETPKMTFHEKLRFIVDSSETIEVDEGMTRLNQEGAIIAAFEALQPYADAGLVPADRTTDVLEIYPMMVYNTTYREDKMRETAQFLYVWYVYLSFDSRTDDAMGIFLDDETGKILTLDWHELGAFQTTEQRWAALAALESIYFTSLELNPVFPVSVSETVPAEEYYEKNGFEQPAIQDYQCVDTVYGELIVQIVVQEYGFYISAY